MNTDQAMSSLWYVLALVLVGSALLVRRTQLSGLIRMAIFWIVIFAILLALFTVGEQSGLFSSRSDGQGERVLSNSVDSSGIPTPPPSRTEGGALRISPSADGHYWVEGTINGTPARFLIDSGASVTALSVNTARAAALNFDLNAPGVAMVTANGRIDAKRSSIASLVIGPIRASDVEIVISPAFGDINVIGMNVLSRLRKWGVEDGQMVLTP